MNVERQQQRQDSAYAIRLRGVCKTHRMIFRSGSRLGAFLYGNLQSRANERDFHAIHDIELDLPKGRMTVIVGENGAGKSTLLRVLSGITPADTGSIAVNGRVSSMLELGFGFHPDLNGYENCFLQGAILGLSRGEIQRRLPAIVEFAGLGAALERPVRYFSAGMFARLAFSLSIHTDPDILLIDEILAVGDMDFQHKSFARILEMRDQGRTILLVSHNLATVNSIADDAVWLKQGRLMEHGPARDVIRDYQRWSNDALHARGAENGGRFENGAASNVRYLRLRRKQAAEARSQFAGEILRLECLDAAGRPTLQPEPLRPFTVRCQYRIARTPDSARFKCLLIRQDGIIVSENATPQIARRGEFPAAGAVDFAFDSLPLVRGQFQVAVGIYAAAGAEREIRLCEREFDFTLLDEHFADQNHTFYIEGACTRVD